MNPITLVQFTDTHLFALASSTLKKINTLDTLNKVLDSISCSESQIDCLVATGDIAQDASLNAYRNFMLSIKKIDAPFRWIPGNHDNVSLMQQISFGTDYSEKKLSIGNWQIILLDTSVKHKVFGRLNGIELEFLKVTLSNVDSDEAIQNVLICLHHNPISSSQGWSEDIGLENRSEFIEIVKRYSSVRCVIFGHLHQEIDIRYEGIRWLCTPSTCVQFLANAIRFELDSSMPGYRRLRLHKDGYIDTEVIRLRDGYELD